MSASLNVITLIGRLTADPELRYTPNGAAVCNFTLAVDREFSKNDETDFIPVVAWQKLAEICNELLCKGKLIAVSGSLQTRTYEDKDGQKRKAFDVRAEKMKMLDSKGGNREGGQGGGGAPRQQAARDDMAAGFPPSGELSDDDIPW